MAAWQKVKCPRCDVLVGRTEVAFHIRSCRGPGSSNRNASVAAAQQPQPAAEMSRWNVREAPPALDVQEDRKSFKLNIQSIVREFDTLPYLARQECSDSVGNLPVLGVSPSVLHRPVDIMIRIRLCMRTPLRTLNFVIQMNAGRYRLSQQRSRFSCGIPVFSMTLTT